MFKALENTTLDNEQMYNLLLNESTCRHNIRLAKINSEIEIVSILDKIGAKDGAVRNNETNYDKVYTTIIKDLREGYLGKITFDNISC